MRSLIVLSALAALALAAPATDLSEEFTYSDKYDGLDVDGILVNDRFRTQYINCFLDTKPCVTPDAIFFKARLPEAIVTKCRKCTEKQKENFNKIAIYMTEHDPENWEAILRKAVLDFTMKGNERRTKEKNAAAKTTA